VAIDSHDGEDRDDYMFRLIRDHILERDPAAKVLVYIGSRHTFESPMGLLDALFVGGQLESFTNGRNASVVIETPDRVSCYVNVTGIPAPVGFSTDSAPLANMAMCGDNSGAPSLEVYYGEDMDAIIVLDR
jgi:hypothetical protein